MCCLCAKYRTITVFLSRVMRCQEEEEEEGQVPGLGTRTGSTLWFSTTARFCDIKQRRNCSFLMRFIVGVISYMEVSILGRPMPSTMSSALLHFIRVSRRHKLVALITANVKLALSHPPIRLSPFKANVFRDML